jgi:hypothetical protein
MTSEQTPESSGLRLVLACGSFRPEIAALPTPMAVEIRYLPQNLHRTPQRLRDALQEAVDAAPPATTEIVLGYGLCSNGLVGLQAREQKLVVPRVHDCVALLLGSRAAYRDAFARRPGSYYLTPGWLEHERDPLGTLEQDYVPRVGRADAEWALHEELKNYTHIVYVRTKSARDGVHRARAERNARFLQKQLEVVDGSPDYLTRLLAGPHDFPDFLTIPPGEAVTQAVFFD